MSGPGVWLRLQFFASRHITPRLPVRQLYQLTGGRIGSSMPSVRPHILLLTVVGRRSGTPRTSPLMYFEIDGKLVVAGTNGAQDRVPQWCQNLRAQPQATVQIGASRSSVAARFTEGAERAQLWSEMKAIHPLFVLYENTASRTIPVVVLDRSPSAT